MVKELDKSIMEYVRTFIICKMPQNEGKHSRWPPNSQFYVSVSAKKDNLVFKTRNLYPMNEYMVPDSYLVLRH